MKEWNEPKSKEELTSFLCFANYLREYFEPQYLKHMETLKPFRKKGCDWSE